MKKIILYVMLLLGISSSAQKKVNQKGSLSKANKVTNISLKAENLTPTKLRIYCVNL